MRVSIGGLSSSEGHRQRSLPQPIQHSVSRSPFPGDRSLIHSQRIDAIYMQESAVPRELMATRGTAGAARPVGPLGERSDRPWHRPRRAGRRGVRSSLRKCKATDGRCIESEGMPKRLRGPAASTRGVRRGHGLAGEQDHVLLPAPNHWLHHATHRSEPATEALLLK